MFKFETRKDYKNLMNKNTNKQTSFKIWIEWHMINFEIRKDYKNLIKQAT